MNVERKTWDSARFATAGKIWLATWITVSQKTWAGITAEAAEATRDATEYAMLEIPAEIWRRKNEQ